MAKIENAIPAWPGWETVRLIGRGSFGAVYEIRKTVLGDTERCALKHISIPRDESEILELRLEGQDGESITRTFTNQARSIVAEYRLMMQLNNCPNVVSSYDVEAVQKDDGCGWDILIRMELLTPLKKYLVQQQDYPETEILRLGREIANALVACRRQKILHRDIKPENIMVAADGTYKLGDFGIARTAEKTGSATAQIGTYAYMAPEVYNGEHYGALADQYSLGMVLYWLLNGRRAPFVTVNTAEEKETALRRRMRGEALPAPLNGSPELKRIVQKCCAYDPKERFQSPEELIRALEQAKKNSEFGNRNSELRQEQTPAPVGAAASRPPATSNAVSSDNTVGAIHESPADPGERRSATVGVGAPDDPQTATDGNRLSRTPAPTSADKTVGVFDHTPVGATFGRPAAASNAETSDNTVGAGLAPAREQGQTTEPTGGASPSPTGEDDENTRAINARKTPQPEPEAPKSNKKKHILLAVCALAAALVLILLLNLNAARERREAYGEAVSLLESEQYEEAIAAFEALGDYEDSTERLQEARYGYALSQQESGQYEEAIAAFEALGDYEDSAAWLIDAQTALAYENALSLLESEQYEEAIAAFEALGDYEDSTELLLEARYGHADALAAEGKNYEAALAFSEIRDYRDSRDRCFALWGQITQRETISAGDAHTVGLLTDGTVVAVGRNDGGRCNVSGWENVVAVSAGWYHTVGLLTDGTVVAVGRNGSGQCEVGDWRDLVAISAGWSHTVGLRSDGTVVAVGRNNSGQCEVVEWTDIMGVSAGGTHTVGLRADGTVVAVGGNGNGQCEVGDWTDIVAVSAGEYHTVGLKADGTVVAVGSNYHGQCDVGDWTDIVAVSAGNYHTVGLQSDGTVVAVGGNGNGQFEVGDWTDIVAVSAGNYHTVGLRSDGTVVSVGYNDFGQCNVSSWTDIALPEKRARN